VRAKKALFIIISVALITSCATPPTTRSKHFKSYSVNVENKVNLGAPMLIVEDITFIVRKRWVGLAYSSDGWEYSKEATDDSFKEELVYTGRSGNTIHISYREYKKDFARPAFFHDLTYDLGQSALIVFRNYKIKVLDATNEYIHFVVLAD